jgi:hypothetical protein
MKNPPTLVIFRADKCGPFAIFPHLPGTYDAATCLVYQRIGQHSAGLTIHMIPGSRPATRREYAPLARELRRIGYRLRIGLRVPRNAYSVRQKLIQSTK